MFQAIGVAVFGVVAIIGLFFAFRAAGPIAPPSESQTAAVAAIATLFDQVGTIDYTKNSTGQEVPYLVYTPEGGVVATKALVFTGQSVCDTKTTSYPCPFIADALRVYMGSGPVHAVGTVVGEHVVIDRLSLL